MTSVSSIKGNNFELYKPNYNKCILQIIIFYIAVISIIPDVLAENGADRGALYFRNGWIGSENVAMGKACEAIVNDVFSIYWNPAGLRELEVSSNFGEQDSHSKEESKITDEELLKFSEDESKDIFLGASAVLLDDKSKAGFLGTSFIGFYGVIGIGIYSLYIEAQPGYSNDLNCYANAGLLSYGMSYGPASFGISLKLLSVKMEDSNSMGIGSDIGTQIEVIPLLKIGIVIQDIVTGIKSESETGNKIDFTYPVLKFSTALDDIYGFTISITGIKAIKDGFEINYGCKYSLYDGISIYIGLNDHVLFCTGISYTLFDAEIIYSFSYNKNDSRYINMFSLTYKI